MSNTLSVCLIVKNEESVIERCLNSLTSFADEICIYDTGSTDNTINICKLIEKVKIIEGEWRDDFAWARNQSFQMATSDYIMWIDADDVIDESSQKYLLEFKQKDLSLYDQVYIMYRYNVTEQNKDDLHFYRERILKRILYPIWNGRIHETAHLSAKSNINSFYIPVSSCYINHIKQKSAGDRNLNIFRDMEKKNEIFRGRDWFYFGNELFEHKIFDEALQKYRNCLDTPNTWEIERLNAALRSAYIYKDVKKDIQKTLYYAYIAASCTLTPRADVCCFLGDFYKNLKKFDWAKSWYERAVNNVVTGLNATFYDESYSTWRPKLNLALCEYELGNKELAIKYNQEVLEIMPDNRDAIHNKSVLEKEN